MFRRSILGAMAGIGIVVLIGCEKSPGTMTAGSSGSAEASVPLPSGLILTTSPANPQNVVDAKQNAKVSDDIVVQGVIGGRKDPFVEGRAVFQLVDSSVLTCDKSPMKDCPTPWDYCCEPSDHIASKSLTVQVLGDDGKPIKTNLNGQSGLKPGAKVIVKGKVADRPDEKTLTIQASGIFVNSSGAGKS